MSGSNKIWSVNIRTRYLVSLAYNQAIEEGLPPERWLGFNILVHGLGPSMRAFFTGWYCDAAVIDVVYLGEQVAVGWLLRSRGQTRLVDFYPMSSTIWQTPFGRETKLLGRTGKPLIEGIVDHLRRRHPVCCLSNTPCP